MKCCKDAWIARGWRCNLCVTKNMFRVRDEECCKDAWIARGWICLRCVRWNGVVKSSNYISRGPFCSRRWVTLPRLSDPHEPEYQKLEPYYCLCGWLFTPGTLDMLWYRASCGSCLYMGCWTLVQILMTNLGGWTAVHDLVCKFLYVPRFKSPIAADGSRSIKDEERMTKWLSFVKNIRWHPRVPNGETATAASKD